MRLLCMSTAPFVVCFLKKLSLRHAAKVDDVENPSKIKEQLQRKKTVEQNFYNNFRLGTILLSEVQTPHIFLYRG